MSETHLPQSVTDQIEAEHAKRSAAGAANARVDRWNFDARYSEVLKPWMLEYAQWLANEPDRPSVVERNAKLNQLTRGRVKGNLHKMLMDREDFQAYLHEITAGPLQAARAAFKSHLPEYVEGHKKAFDMALAAEDYSKIKDYTIPALERVWPRRDLVAQQTNVTITLSEKQAANIETEAIEVEAEIIE